MAAKKKGSLSGKRSLPHLFASAPSTPPQQALTAKELHLHIFLPRLKPSSNTANTSPFQSNKWYELNIGTHFLGRCFPSEVSSPLSHVPGGLFLVHMRRYVEKLILFVPLRGKLDPIKELDIFFLVLPFLLFLVALWKNFSLEDTLNNTEKNPNKHFHHSG